MILAEIYQGNPDVHVILRGGSKGPNYAAEYVRDCHEKLSKAGLPGKIMVSSPDCSSGICPNYRYCTQIDCSHGNSQKQHRKQIEVVDDIVSHVRVLIVVHETYLVSSQARQLSSVDTSTSIMGVMLESNLVEGRQDIPANGPAGLKYGQSVTDACLSWEMTIPALDRLREGVRARRDLVARNARGCDTLTNGVKDLKLNGVNGVNKVNGVNGANGVNAVNGVNGTNGVNGVHKH
jgi:3-deoxy-7-phosphoheptulonate synthase